MRVGLQGREVTRWRFGAFGWGLNFQGIFLLFFFFWGGVQKTASAPKYYSRDLRLRSAV